MSKALDLREQKFGRLTAIRPMPGERRHGSAVWECVCDCGVRVCVPTSSLRSGNTQSCGCLRQETLRENAKKGRVPLDLTGQRFGRLTALRPVAGKRYHGFVVWECICDCGKKVSVASGMLRSGHTRSCGCLGNGRKHFDLEGQRFGRLVAIRLLWRGNKIFWECFCDCGKVTFVETGSLVSGNTKSCGCLPLEIMDLTGQRFGRWTVVAFVEKIKSQTRWLCRCDCGNEAVVYGFSLRSGRSQSCGCLKRELTSARLRRTDLTDAEREQDRKYSAYYEWRDAVYGRDDYTCQVCNVRGGHLRAHHLESFTAKRRLRTVMENGVTLCAKCHDAFHREYGKITTRKQFDSWLYIRDLSERLEAGEFDCEQTGVAVVR